MKSSHRASGIRIKVKLCFILLSKFFDPFWRIRFRLLIILWHSSFSNRRPFIHVNISRAESSPVICSLLLNTPPPFVCQEMAYFFPFNLKIDRLFLIKSAIFGSRTTSPTSYSLFDCVSLIPSISSVINSGFTLFKILNKKIFPGYLSDVVGKYTASIGSPSTLFQMSSQV